MQLNTREDVGRDERVGPYTGACGEAVIEPIEPVNLGDGASLDESLFAISPGVMVTQQPGIEVVWPNFTLESKEKERETARPRDGASSSSKMRCSDMSSYVLARWRK